MCRNVFVLCALTLFLCVAIGNAQYEDLMVNTANRDKRTLDLILKKFADAFGYDVLKRPPAVLVHHKPHEHKPPPPPPPPPKPTKEPEHKVTTPNLFKEIIKKSFLINFNWDKKHDQPLIPIKPMKPAHPPPPPPPKTTKMPMHPEMPMHPGMHHPPPPKATPSAPKPQPKPTKKMMEHPMEKPTKVEHFNEEDFYYYQPEEVPVQHQKYVVDYSQFADAGGVQVAPKEYEDYGKLQFDFEKNFAEINKKAPVESAPAPAPMHVENVAPQGHQEQHFETYGGYGNEHHEPSSHNYNNEHYDHHYEDFANFDNKKEPKAPVVQHQPEPPAMKKAPKKKTMAKPKAHVHMETKKAPASPPKKQHHEHHYEMYEDYHMKHSPIIQAKAPAVEHHQQLQILKKAPAAPEPAPEHHHEEHHYENFADFHRKEAAKQPAQPQAQHFENDEYVIVTEPNFEKHYADFVDFSTKNEASQAQEVVIPEKMQQKQEMSKEMLDSSWHDFWKSTQLKDANGYKFLVQGGAEAAKEPQKAQAAKVSQEKPKEDYGFFETLYYYPQESEDLAHKASEGQQFGAKIPQASKEQPKKHTDVVHGSFIPTKLDGDEGFIPTKLQRLQNEDTKVYSVGPSPFDAAYDSSQIKAHATSMQKAPDPKKQMPKQEEQYMYYYQPDSYDTDYSFTVSPESVHDPAPKVVAEDDKDLSRNAKVRTKEYAKRIVTVHKNADRRMNA